MPFNGNPTAVRRIVLEGGGFVDRLKAYLPCLTLDVDQAYHELMYAIVESLRYRDKAATKTVEMYRALERNLDSSLGVKHALMDVVRDFTLYLYFQIENHDFYDADGVLMFTYMIHPDKNFDAVLLNSIIQLTWNGEVYAPAPN